MSTKGGRIVVSREETIYRERSFTRAQVIELLTDEIDDPPIPRERLARMSDNELADELRRQANDTAVYDSLDEGYWELYEQDSGYGPFTVEVAR